MGVVIILGTKKRVGLHKLAILLISKDDQRLGIASIHQIIWQQDEFSRIRNAGFELPSVLSKVRAIKCKGGSSVLASELVTIIIEAT